MARIPETELERLKSEVSLERLAEARGVKLERRGADLHGLCPFHPVGKGPGTRSDIDFRIDTDHPNVDSLIKDLGKVGGGAGNASLKHGTNHRPTYPPVIRTSPGGS